MTKLHIADGLSLPLDWMTLATVVYGARGSGKTTLGSVIAEEVTKAKQRFCAVDLKGDWYGLKSTADGKGEGIPVVVWGGDHADVPLEPDAGAFVAETVAGMSQSCILDFEQFSKGKQVRFLAAFFETLYDRNRDPLLLLLDEAQRYAPQKPIDPEAAKCLGAVEDLVKLGRKHGIGPTLFTQRGSGLNKEVSELCDMMVAFRTPGPLDQDRVKGWLEANTTKAQLLEVMGSLSGLPTGTAIFASGHPDLKVFGTYAVRRRETFDSSATPRVGQRKVEPKKLAQPDLDALRTKMAAAIERQKADDPKELRAVIVSLRKELTAAQKAAPLPKVVTETVEKAVLKDGQITRLEKAAERLEGAGIAYAGLVNIASEIGLQIKSALSAVHATSGDVTRTAVRAGGDGPQRSSATAKGQDRPAVAFKPGLMTGTLRRDNGASGSRGLRDVEMTPARTTDGVSRSQQRILDVLAWLEMVNVTPAAKAQVAGLAGQSPTSGGYFNNLGKLRSAGLIDYVDTKVVLTDAGRSAAQQPDQPPTNEQLHDQIVAKVSGSQGRILRELIGVYPDDLGKDELAQRVGQSPTSGGYFNNLGRLRGLGFIEYPGQGRARAADILFLEAAAR